MQRISKLPTLFPNLGSPPSNIRRGEKLRYRLIFKYPEVRQAVASFDFIDADTESAVARCKRIAGHMYGELWQGETCLETFTPDQCISSEHPAPFLLSPQ